MREATDEKKALTEKSPGDFFFVPSKEARTRCSMAEEARVRGCIFRGGVVPPPLREVSAVFWCRMIVRRCACERETLVEVADALVHYCQHSKKKNELQVFHQSIKVRKWLSCQAASRALAKI